MVMKKINGFLLVLVLALMTSCRIKPPAATPEIEIPDRFGEVEAISASVEDIEWAALYQDTILTMLIRDVIANNKDLKIAGSKIRELQEHKRIKNADLLPYINLEVNSDYELLLNYGWELDLWGNLRWIKEESILQYLQSIEAAKAIQMTVVAETSRLYFTLITLEKRLIIINQTLEARSEAVRFAALRYQGGLTSEIPYRQSLVEFARTQTLIPDIQDEINSVKSDLALLLGEQTLNISDTLDPHWSFVINDIPVDLPSDVLKRRPDVIEAELRLQEAYASLGVAYTDMFPKINLTGSYGRSSEELSKLLSSPYFYIIGSLTSPLINMSKKRAGYRAAIEAYNQEVLRYEQKILQVFREVNNSIYAFNKAKEMHDHAEELYISAKSYNDLAIIQYVNGAISYIDVLDAQRQLFDAELLVNNAILNQLTTAVNLYKALGGGVK